MTDDPPVGGREEGWENRDQWKRVGDAEAARTVQNAEERDRKSAQGVNEAKTPWEHGKAGESAQRVRQP